MFSDEKAFCKEGFVLKIVSNMEKRGKDKPLEFKMLYEGTE
jgi:hypothetical protein